MSDNQIRSHSTPIEFEDLKSDFLSLRVGEEIPRLEIMSIRKIVNKNKEYNLAGVDYKYMIETTDNKILMINSWALWNKISAALLKAGKTQVCLKLQHTGIDKYDVQVV